MGIVFKVAITNNWQKATDWIFIETIEDKAPHHFY
jgi:hypothetical protein